VNRAEQIADALTDAGDFDPREYLMSGETLPEALLAAGFKAKPSSNADGTNDHPGYERIDSIHGEDGPFEQGDTMWQVTIWDKDLAILRWFDYVPDPRGQVWGWKFPAQGGEQRMSHVQLQDMLSTLGESKVQEAEDFDAAAYWKEPQWPPTGFEQNGPKAIYGHQSKEPFTDAEGRKYRFNIHIYPEDRQYILTVYGRYFDSWHDFHQEIVKFDDDFDGYMEAIKKAISTQKPSSRSYPRLPDFEPFKYDGVRESEDEFDPREYLLRHERFDPAHYGFQMRNGDWTLSTKHPEGTTVTLKMGVKMGHYIGLRMEVSGQRIFGTVLKADWLQYHCKELVDAFKNAVESTPDWGEAQLAFMESIRKFQEQSDVQESEDFDPREYLMQRVADEDELRMRGAVKKEWGWEMTNAKDGANLAFFHVDPMWNMVLRSPDLLQIHRWSGYLSTLLPIADLYVWQPVRESEDFDAREYMMDLPRTPFSERKLGEYFCSDERRNVVVKKVEDRTISPGRVQVVWFKDKGYVQPSVPNGRPSHWTHWGMGDDVSTYPPPPEFDPKQVMVESVDDFDPREYMLADQGLADLRHWLETNGFQQSKTASHESWKRSFWYHNTNARAGRRDRSDYNIWEAPDKPGEWYFQRKDTTQSRRSGVREDIIQQFHGTPADILPICKKWVPNDRHAELRDPMQEAVSTMPLADILAKTEPMDYSGYTWEQAFKSIENNHVAADPAHWDKFLESVRQHGIRQPVEIERWGDKMRLWKGHHRVWAAHKLGIKDVPVKLSVREAEDLPAPADDFDARDYLVGSDERELEQALIARGFRRSEENYWTRTENVQAGASKSQRRYDHIVHKEGEGENSFWIYRRYGMDRHMGPGGHLDSKVSGDPYKVIDALETWDKQKALRQFIHQESEEPFDARSYLLSTKKYEGPPGKEFWVLFKEGEYQRAVKLYKFAAAQRFVHDKNLERDPSLILRVRRADDEAMDYVREPDGTYVVAGASDYRERFVDPEAPVAESEDENILQYALNTPVKPIGWIGVSPETKGKLASYLNTRRPFMADVIGDAQVFKRRSSLNGWPHLEAVPVYSDPRRTGMGALDPYHKPPVYTRKAIQVPESMADDIAKEAEKAEQPKSEEQAEAGNQKKGHIHLHGWEIGIENAKGSVRKSKDPENPWQVTMPAHYGYIKGTTGKDKDHLDVYIGEHPSALLAFVVNQKKKEGGFDEHKIMLGFQTKDEAIETYDAAFTGDLGPKLRDEVFSVTIDSLKAWIDKGDTKKPFKPLEESRAAFIARTLLEAEDFDARDYLLTTPSERFVIVAKNGNTGETMYYGRPTEHQYWVQAPNAAERFNSREAAMEVIAKFENPFVQMVVRQDRTMESEDFDPREYLMSEPTLDDMLRQDLKQLGFTLFKARTTEDSEEVWIADRGSVVHTVSQREDGGGWSYHRNTIPDYNFSTGPENMMRSLPRYVRESDEDFDAREYFASMDAVPLGRAVDISDDIWKDDNKLRRAFSWMTRIGAAPKFGTTSIHNYQTEQCEKLDAIKVYARQKGVMDVKWVRYRNGRILAYDVNKWVPVASLIYGNLVPNVR